jgi:hypothetical protein
MKTSKESENMTPLLSTALDGNKWSTPCPCHYTLEKWHLVSLKMKLGGLKSQSKHYKKTKQTPWPLVCKRTIQTE